MFWKNQEDVYGKITGWRYQVERRRNRNRAWMTVGLFSIVSFVVVIILALVK